MSAELRVPPLGTPGEVRLTRWYSEPGEAVKRGEVLVELQTERFFAEVFAPADGVLGPPEREAGATVREGDLLAVIN